MKCVFVGNGEFCSEQFCVAEQDFVIAVDGGYAHIKDLCRVDLAVGDFDSLGYIPEGIATLRHDPIKDYTDMYLAFDEARKRGCDEFEVYGALGGRLDHTLANIQCLLYLMNRGARGTIVGDDVTLMLIKDTKMCFPADFSQRGRRISVFAYGGDAYGVSERGLKYLLDEVTVKQEFPIGVSNEFIGEPAEVEVQRGILLLCVEEY